MSYDADTTSCGTVTFMPRLDETSPALIAHLRVLMDEYGPRGVYDACAQLMNENPTAHPGWAGGHNVFGVTEELGIEAVDLGITKGLGPNGGQLIGDVIKLDRQYTDDELRNSPYAGTFADVVAASQDPAPMKAMVQITGDGDYDEPHAYPENADVAQAAYDDIPTTYTVDAITDVPEDFDAWKQQRGEATGDPQNVGPMGNR